MRTTTKVVPRIPARIKGPTPSAPPPPPPTEEEQNDEWMEETNYFWAVFSLAIAHGMIAFITLVVIINVNIPDTLTWGMDFGTYFSLRYTSGWWAMYFLMAFRLMVCPVVMCLLLFRNERCMCSPRKGGWTIFWSIILGILLLLEISIMVISGSYYTTRNGQNVPHQNPASAYETCCRVSVWSDPNNNCPVTAPGCPPDLVIPDTNPDFIFQWILDFFALAILIIICILCILMWSDETLSVQFRTKETAEELDDVADTQLLLN